MKDLSLLDCTTSFCYLRKVHIYIQKINRKNVKVPERKMSDMYILKDEKYWKFIKISTPTSCELNWRFDLNFLFIFYLYFVLSLSTLKPPKWKEYKDKTIRGEQEWNINVKASDKCFFVDKMNIKNYFTLRGKAISSINFLFIYASEIFNHHHHYSKRGSET